MNPSTKPRMPPKENLAPVGNVGVLAFSCTTKRDRTAPSGIPHWQCWRTQQAIPARHTEKMRKIPCPDGGRLGTRARSRETPTSRGPSLGFREKSAAAHQWAPMLPACTWARSEGTDAIQTQEGTEMARPAQVVAGEKNLAAAERAIDDCRHNTSNERANEALSGDPGVTRPEKSILDVIALPALIASEVAGWARASSSGSFILMDSQCESSQGKVLQQSCRRLLKKRLRDALDEKNILSKLPINPAGSHFDPNSRVKVSGNGSEKPQQWSSWQRVRHAHGASQFFSCLS